MVVTGATAANQSRSQVQHFSPAPVGARGAAALEGLSCGCKMAVPLAVLSRKPPAVEPVALAIVDAAGSRVRHRMDRRGTRGPCAGQEARHQERHRRPAPAGVSLLEGGI